jgi:hypothetical protein
MDDKIIDIETEVTPVEAEPTDEMSKKIKELNEQMSNDQGEWMWSKEFGLVWCPNLANKENKPLGVPPSTPPVLLEDIVNWGNTLDLDNVKENSVILIKICVDDPFHLQMMQNVIVKQVLTPRIEKLKEKKVCVLFMRAGDDISIMDEEDMSKAGWEKKEKSRIITL